MPFTFIRRFLADRYRRRPKKYFQESFPTGCTDRANLP